MTYWHHSSVEWYPAKESIFTFLCFQQILEQMDSTINLIFRISCFCLCAYVWISLLLKRPHWRYHLSNVIVHVPSGCLSPLYYLLYKQSPSMGLITWSDRNSLPLLHYGQFVLALTSYVETVAMTVQSPFWLEKTFFLRPNLLDFLQLNLSGINWAQRRPNKGFTVLTKISIVIAWKKT